MDYIKGFTFGWMSRKGDFLKSETKQSLRLLKENTATTHVILTLAALQETAQSIDLDYKGNHIVSDEELIAMIRFAQSLGLKVILKPTVNVKDGTWRAHINFFDIDVPCEPKWKDWFISYLAYQKHYARIAEATGCEMLIIGCEMVQTERRADDWRHLIDELRQTYRGLISYNTDKYQEGNVSWWDAVDVISSSAYYPINDWDNQLERIEAVLSFYNKPFFFAEAGCPSRTGSAFIPNDWNHHGSVNLKEQAEYYQIMFEKTTKRPWVRGFGLWDWKAELYNKDVAGLNDDYGVFGKPAEQVIRQFYLSK